MPWAPPGWDDYISSIIGPPPNPLANDPEPGSPDPLTEAPVLPPMPATQEAVSELRQQKLDEAFAKGTGPYPEGARTDVARIAQSTGPTGTINQIGHDNLGQQQEAPSGWEGLSPAEDAQIEIDGIQTPPLLGEVDAVSGPAPSTVAQAVDVTGVDKEQPAPDLLTPSDAALPSVREREDEQNGEQLGADMSKKSPEEQAMFLAKLAATRDNFAASRALEESNKAAEQAHELGRVRDEAIKKSQARRAELEAQAKQIADTDPTSTIPGYKKVLGVLASFIGGFAANKSGRNVGLEIVDSIANDAAQQQAQKLGVVKNQIAGVGEDVAAADTAYRTGEAVRIATYDASIKALQSEVQLYDPKGSTAARVMQTLGEIQARRAAAVEKFHQQTFDNEMKAGELAIKTRHQGLEEAKYLSAEQRAAMKAASGTGIKQSPEFWEAYSTRPGAPGERPPMPMTEKEYHSWLATAGKVKTLNKGPNDKSEAQVRKEEADATKSEAEAAAATSGYALKNPETGHVFKNPDGTPVLEMDATKRNRTSSIIEAATNIRRVADKMAALKKKYGGSLETLGGDESQELKNLTSMIDFETFKAFDLGAPSEGDKALAEGVRGGVNPTSFIRNSTAGFQAYAENVEKKANTALRNSGYIGPALRFHRESDVKASAPTVVDEIGGKLTSALLKTPKADPNNPVAQGVEKFNQAIVAPENKQTDELFQQLAAFAELPNDQGDLAKDYLRKLAEKAVYPDAKKRAKAILDGLPGSNARTDEAR
jgi:hypothetical protein